MRRCRASARNGWRYLEISFTSFSPFVHLDSDESFLHVKILGKVFRIVSQFFAMYRKFDSCCAVLYYNLADSRAENITSPLKAFMAGVL